MYILKFQFFLYFSYEVVKSRAKKNLLLVYSVFLMKGFALLFTAKQEN